MMRSSSGIVCAVAGALLFAVACSWGGASDPNNHPDAGGTSHAVCGDGTCAATEINNCPQDCGSGGHGSNGGSGSGSGSNIQPICGNNVCDPGEDANSCPADCTGGGSGSGTLNCSDPNTIIACGLCSAFMVCTGVDAAGCAACGF